MKKMLLAIVCLMIVGMAVQSYVQADWKETTKKKYQAAKGWAGRHKKEIAGAVAVGAAVAVGGAVAKQQYDANQAADQEKLSQPVRTSQQEPPIESMPVDTAADEGEQYASDTERLESSSQRLEAMSAQLRGRR